MNLQQFKQASEEELVELAFQALQSALERCDIPVIRYNVWLVHEASGFGFSPRLFEVQAMDNDRVRTGTTVDIIHPDLFPEPIFEYQYSFAENDVLNCMVEGFKLWIDSDVSVLLASIDRNPQGFMSIEMDFSTDGEPLQRQVIFGNVLRYGGKPSTHDKESDHDFCPCCLFTQNIELFHSLLKVKENYAIRLFVSKNSDTGETNADCRVNGEEWEHAVPKLKQYAEKWDSEDYEFRKQYVIIKTL